MGSYAVEDYFDNDGVDDTPLTVSLAVTVEARTSISTSPAHRTPHAGR